MAGIGLFTEFGIVFEPEKRLDQSRPPAAGASLNDKFDCGGPIVAIRGEQTSVRVHHLCG
jgi:hypothetical protein